MIPYILTTRPPQPISAPMLLPDILSAPIPFQPRPVPTAEQVAAELVEIKLLSDALADRRARAIAQLEAIHELEGVEALDHAGFRVARSAGRPTYDYSADPSVSLAKGALQAAQDAAVLAGRATVKSQTPFWSVRSIEGKS